MGTSLQSSSGTNFTDNNNAVNNKQFRMRSEECRLSTFSGWPHNDKVEARKIAKAGFFRTGIDSSEVKCTWCGCILAHWDYGDQVMSRHRTASPDCPFIRNVSDNIPLVNGDAMQNDNQQQNASQSESDDTTDHGDSPDEIERTNEEAIDVVNVTNLDAWKSEAARLATFGGFNSPYVRPADLASAGFVFTGRNDVVRCVFCGQYVGNWDPNDSPHTEHRKISPDCPFVRGLDVGNVPIANPINQMFTEASSSSRPPINRYSYDHVSAHGYDETGIRPRRDANSGPEKGPDGVLQQLSSKNGDEIGIIRHSGPAHTKYSTAAARLRSFRDWPPALKQQPEQLSEAGFYYIGLSDQVKCFYCDGGLRNWQPEDDPWIEHARWFSKCGFIRLTKGDEFIAQWVAKRPPEVLADSPTSSMNRQTAITEDEMKTLMTSPIVQQVLSMGIDLSRVKLALRKKLRDTGIAFSTTQDLLQASLQAQLQQEDRVEVENAASLPTPMTSSTSTPSLPTAATKSESQQKRIQSVSATNLEQRPVLNGIKDKPNNNTAETLEPKQVSGLQLKDGSDLEQENRRLKEQRTCKICMDREIGVVFLPCGHLICCAQCVPPLKNCPLCRQPIQGTVKTYMS